MITVKFKVPGSKTIQTKEFSNQVEFNAWKSGIPSHGSDALVILEVETSGKALAGKLNSLFGC